MSKELRLQRFAVASYFLIGGTAIAVWGVHIPEVEHRLNITHSIIGSIILLFGLGAFLAMQAMGWVIDHYGSKIVTALGGIATGLGLMIPAFAANVPTLSVGIFLLGAAVGTLDVGMNANGVIVERSYDRSIFSGLHAMWSVGGIVGAMIGALALGANSPMWLTLTVSGLAMAAGSAALWPLLAKGKLDNKPSTTSRSDSKMANRKVLGTVLLVGLMACFAAISEGSAVDWSALELKTVLGASDSVAALGVGAFSATMAITRLLGDRLVDKLGRFAVVRYGALIASGGIAIAAFVPNQLAAILGWAILGVGISGIIPQLFIASGNIGEASHAGRNMAKVFGLTYFGIMAGPALIGVLTNFLPLNHALAIGAILCLLVSLSSPILRSEKFNDKAV